jgi:GAF domain-containing protein
VVDDVHKSPDWLPNPLLPDTQAEIAVPIISQGKLVGVLDVQENRVAGLDDSDADLLQFLAHQVAIALQNAELFSQTQAALEEVQAIHRRYLAEGWQTFLQSTPVTYAEAQQQALPSIEVAAWQSVKARVLQEDDIVQETLEPAGQNGPVASQAAMVAPLKLRGETIGTLGIQRNADGSAWSREEVALVQAISEQVSVALENARLFAESQRRAAREETIAYLTQAIWVGDSIESVLEQSVVYLGQTLNASKVILRLLPKHSQLDADRNRSQLTLKLNP